MVTENEQDNLIDQIANRVVELQGKSKTPAGQAEIESLVTLGMGLLIFTGQDGWEYAHVQIGNVQEVIKVNGRKFPLHLRNLHRELTGRIAKPENLHTAIQDIQARLLTRKANGELPARTVNLRSHHADNTVYIDRCDTDRHIVKITADGVDEITTPDGVYFFRSDTQLPLPPPEPNGSLSLLREALNLDDEAWALFQPWLCSLYMGFPVCGLNLVGGAGTVKSSTARAIINLVDPRAGYLPQLPKDVESMQLYALNSRIVGYDNVGPLSNVFSDTLCGTITGGGGRRRTLYIDDKETIFSVKRPVLLTSVNNVITQPDLADRFIVIRLPVVREYKRESSIDSLMESIRPRVFGAICETISKALRVSQTEVNWDKSVRMADYAHWLECLTPALKYKPGELVGALIRNRAESASNTLADKLGEALIDFAHSNSGTKLSVGELFDLVSGKSDDVKSARGLSAYLQRHENAFQRLGIQFRPSTHRHKTYLTVCAN